MLCCRQDQWRASFDRWKYLNGVPHDAKVFIVRGGYPFIRQALTARGWCATESLECALCYVFASASGASTMQHSIYLHNIRQTHHLKQIFRHENKDSESDFFDYKWTLKTKHLSRFRLHDCQYINHFRNSFACLTTKVGLLTVRPEQLSCCSHCCILLHPLLQMSMYTSGKHTEQRVILIPGSSVMPVFSGLNTAISSASTSYFLGTSTRGHDARCPPGLLHAGV